MGNIISNTSNLNTSSGQIGRNDTLLNQDGSVNTFVQNMTDILLELNLNSTGNYNMAGDTNKAGPRSEFDYSINAYTKKPVTSLAQIGDLHDGKRPATADGSNYIDIFGIPYVTTETPNSNVPNLQYTITGSYAQ
jgi:hypothetical protein